MILTFLARAGRSHVLWRAAGAHIDCKYSCKPFSRVSNGQFLEFLVPPL